MVAVRKKSIERKRKRETEGCSVVKLKVKALISS